MNNSGDGYSIEDYRNDIRLLFEKVKAQKPLEPYLLHILPAKGENGQQDTYIEWDLLPYVLTNNYGVVAALKYLRSHNMEANVIMQVQLLAYLQILETRYIHKVLGNCLRALNGEESKGELYDDNKDSGCQCFNRYKKGLTKHSGLPKKMELFFDCDLRNAIAHNNYLVHRESKLLTIPTDIIALTKPTQAGKTPKSYSTYTFERINHHYQEAQKFFDAFKEEIQPYTHRLIPNYLP